MAFVRLEITSSALHSGDPALYSEMGLCSSQTEPLAGPQVTVALSLSWPGHVPLCPILTVKAELS